MARYEKTSQRDPSALQTEIIEELSIKIPSEDLQSYDKLNTDQRKAFHIILQSATKVVQGHRKVFFIDGPGGTGKTFLYRSLLAHFRRRGLIAIATATYGLAAIMMPGGRTAHSRFKIPIPITATSTCKIGKHSGLAELLRQAAIIIWDEATMTHRHAFEALDRSLRDITGVNEIFGGKLFLMGGDFRQVLPVVPQGSRTDIINSCLRNSYIWDQTQVLHLQQNMRALNDLEFSDILLRIGNGEEPHTADDMIRLPEAIVLQWENENSIEKLISTIFPYISVNASDTSYMTKRAIITTTNEHVDMINDRVITYFPGEEISYYSFDSVENDPKGLYQLEFLNSICQGNLPPHKLTLKLGCPIMLARNIVPRSGLCNGTRLLCHGFDRNLIDAEIVTGTYRGQTAFIPRIPLKSTEDMKIPFALTRKQFPIRLSFALTIHKSQGQTIPHVGIYLPHIVFTHGQLYVALSRGKSRINTKIMVRNGSIEEYPGIFTRNVVYNEVLI